MRAGELAVGQDVHPRGDEVPGPQLGGLAFRHRLDHRVVADPVARPQVTDVLLLAVRRDHRGVSGAVEQVEQLVVGRGAARAVAVPREATHRPCLKHRRRRYGVRPRVGGMGVAHRLAPVPDHRRVDQVLADAGAVPRAAPRTSSTRQGRSASSHPRSPFPRFIPSRIVATISRCTSLTPPPNVLICAALFIRSSSPSPKAPGEPPGSDPLPPRFPDTFDTFRPRPPFP